MELSLSEVKWIEETWKTDESTHKSHVAQSQENFSSRVAKSNNFPDKSREEIRRRMPSEAAKKRQAKKKAASQSRGKPKPAAENGVEDSKVVKNGASAKTNLSNRSCTGVLASHELSRDVKIENFSITFHGVELLTDTKLELNCGRRYGLLGLNGCGKFPVYIYFFFFKCSRGSV